MKPPGWGEWHGAVTRGHRVASGQGGDPRFPQGTVAMQLPLLREALPELETWLGGAPFAGTINIALDDARIGPGTPDATLPALRWTAHFAPETFFLSRVVLVHAGIARRAWLYVPDPATKPPDHPARVGVVELLAQEVPDLSYGAPVRLRCAPRTLRITAG